MVGTGQGVQVRRQPAVDMQVLQREHEKMSRMKQQLEDQMKAANTSSQATFQMTDTDAQVNYAYPGYAEQPAPSFRPAHLSGAPPL